MTALITTLIILASVLLIIVVFVQNPKGGGLSTDFGASHQLGGVKKTTDFIEKATWSLAAVIMVLSIWLTLAVKPPKPKVIKADPKQEQAPQAPAGNKAPAGTK
jgi:preprotein translocase subunit SecG